MTYVDDQPADLVRPDQTGSAVQDGPLRHTSDQFVRVEKRRRKTAQETGQGLQPSVQHVGPVKEAFERFEWARKLREDCRHISSDNVVAQVIAEHFNPKFG